MEDLYQLPEIEESQNEYTDKKLIVFVSYLNSYCKSLMYVTQESNQE